MEYLAGLRDFFVSHRLVLLFTEPARPGDLSADVYQGPNVTIRFTRSNGSVDTYAVNITQRDNSSFTMKKDVSGTGQGDVVVTFYGLTPDKVYDVEIQARSGGLYGDIKEDSFRVSAERKIRLIFVSLFLGLLTTLPTLK